MDKKFLNENDFLNAYPEFQFAPSQLTYDREINPAMYASPWTAEGEAEKIGKKLITFIDT